MSDPNLPARPEPDDTDLIDWGGDGSDLNEPVRDHVLAALRPTSDPYPDPVAELLELGDAHDKQVIARRESLGIGQEHLPELVRMARDRGLYTLAEEDPAGWAPIHAGQLLADLDVSAIVDELIPLFDLENDWFSTSLPKALGKAGRPALEPIRAYLLDQTRWEWGHAHSISVLEEAVEQHPELHDEVVAILAEVLRNVETYGEPTNSFAMSLLVELQAVETLPLIRRAFELNKIDEMVHGPWGMILDELGIEPEPGDPLIEQSRRRDEERREQMFPRAMRERLAALVGDGEAAPEPAPDRSASRRNQQKARKEKNKRKAAAASRKANRKKRK